MKKTPILLIGMAMIFIFSCQQKKSDSTQSELSSIDSEAKTDPNETVFGNLDVILSPFEDMTEFALEKNRNGILESMSKIEDAASKGFFEQNLTAESVKLLNPKIEILKELISKNNYSQIALVSAEIFDFNISNFADGNKIESQIKIEHLDYMGFKVSALLNQDKIDWGKVKQTVEDTKGIWLTLSPKVKDGNLKGTFDYLFEGLLLSAENKEAKICGILANMDLTLVDVLEKSM